MRPSEYSKFKVMQQRGECEITLGNHVVADIIANEPSVDGKPFTVITTTGHRFWVDDSDQLWVESPEVRDALWALKALKDAWPKGFQMECIQETLKALEARRREIKNGEAAE